VRLVDESMRASVLVEPQLRFGFGQSSANPKHGLFLFGPLREHGNPTEIRCGVIGTPTGLRAFRSWTERIQRSIPATTESNVNVFFPGFKEIFNCNWPTDPAAEISLSGATIAAALHRSDRHDAIHATVGLFANAIDAYLRDEDRRVDLWFVVIPDVVFELGRPRSVLPTANRIESDQFMNARLAKRLMREPSLFVEDMQAANTYLYQVDFHNQLKARLIRCRAITQVIRESTFGSDQPNSRRRMQDDASIAWNLSVSSFYKAGGRPWRLKDIREDVCYVGLVFKHDNRGDDLSYACCGAQMFLTSGEGMVFKGLPGQYYSPKSREFHLSGEQASQIGTRVIEAYRAQTGKLPKELFIHGRTRLNDEEWNGFLSSMPEGVKLSGVRISRSDEFKLYRPGRMPVLRGTVAMESDNVGFLWASGFVTELETYPGWEVPNPLRIEVCRGDSPIETVVADVFQLTKLNFNACIFGDGLPVTLRFADAIGEILTAAPASDIPDTPLPFRHYI
jgi:hypothetical protein